MITFLSALGDKLDIDEVTNTKGEKVSVEETMFSQGRSVVASKPYQVIDGIGIISVAGTLVNKNGYLEPQSGMHGYDGIQAQFAMAMDDPSVSKIIFDIDSHGGEVAGCFDLCDLIHGFRDEKETVAFVGEHATSAAYALASSCSKVFTPRTGQLGSIGVLVAHHDLSKKLDDDGIKVTLIHSGSNKVEGNPYEPLSEEVKGKIQSRIDKTRTLFAETVARNRGLTVDEVLATEASVYEGAEAVKKGLADAVMSFNEVIQTMVENVNEASIQDDAVMEGEELTVEASAPEFDPVLEETQMDAKELALMCKEAAADHLIAGLLDSCSTISDVEEKLGEYAELQDVLTAEGFSAEAIAKVDASGSQADLARAIFDARADEDDIAAQIPEQGNQESASSKHDFYKFQN